MHKETNFSEWRQSSARQDARARGKPGAQALGVIGDKPPGRGELQRELGPVWAELRRVQTRSEEQECAGRACRGQRRWILWLLYPPGSASRNRRRVPPYSTPHPCPLSRNLNHCGEEGLKRISSTIAEHIVKGELQMRSNKLIGDIIALDKRELTTEQRSVTQEGRCVQRKQQIILWGNLNGNGCIIKQ